MNRRLLFLLLLLLAVATLSFFTVVAKPESVHPSLRPQASPEDPGARPVYTITWTGADSGYRTSTLIYDNGARRDAPEPTP